MDTARLIELFSSKIDRKYILDSPRDLEFYGRDACQSFKSAAALILTPPGIEEVVEIVRICKREKLGLVPSGGRTGYSGGATAAGGEIVISLERLNKILDVDPAALTLRCQAGASTEAVRIRAAEHGLFYPVEFPSRGSSQIGGNIATNAGGIRVIRYGSTRDWVLGLKVVTGSGELLELNGELYKNQTGYDLRSLFIGSEGTLGIIVEAVLKLTRPPAEAALALCALAGCDGTLEAIKFLRSKGHVINVFEYFERDAVDLVMSFHKLKDPFSARHQFYVLLEVEADTPGGVQRFEESLEEMVESGTLKDAVLSQSSKHYKELMSFRELISDSIARHTLPHKNDISVPISSIPAFISGLKAALRSDYPDYNVLIFGHIGDGNLHVNVLKPKDLPEEKFLARCAEVDHRIFAMVQKYSGSISAEHGVGLLKKPYLQYSRTGAEIELMRQIKRSLDPNNIMNPGKIFEMV